MSAPLVLIDLSSLAHPLFHLSGSEPNPNWTSIQIVSRIRAIGSGQPHVVVCCDCPPYFRKAIDPSYKANRPESDATLMHQIALSVETLRGDGFPVWAVKGYEADDLIASTVERVNPSIYLKNPDGSEKRLDIEPARDVLIVSADKDLMQLVGPRVQQLRPALGSSPQTTYDEAAVLAKFGVTPAQIGDYLALVGDTSDNIKGAKGIGPKRAVELLTKHGTLAGIMATGGEGMTPAVRDSLVEFAGRCDAVRSLIALRTDAPVKIEEAFAPRVAQESSMDDTLKVGDVVTPAATYEAPTSGPKVAGGEPESRVDRAADTSVDSPPRLSPDNPTAALVPHVVPAPAPAAWEMQLDPRSMSEARQLAADMFSSRLFSAYGNAPAVLSTILAGRELGLQAMASLRAFHIIENKPTLSAGIIQAMVLKSSACEYFRCTARSNEAATFVGKRRGNPEVSLTFSVEDARRAWSGEAAKFDKSGWGRNPADLCVARAATKLARLLWPDVTSGLYATEEME